MPPSCAHGRQDGTDERMGSSRAGMTSNATSTPWRRTASIISRLCAIACARSAVLRLDVRDLQACCCVAGRAQRFAEADVVVRVAIAHVRRVQPVPPLPATSHNGTMCSGAQILPGPVLQAGREAVRPLVERFAEQLDHALRLVDRRRAKLVAHHRPVDRAVAHERRHVHAEPTRVEAFQVLAEALPAHVDAAVVGVPDSAAPGVTGAGDRRAAMPALPDDLGGDALVHLALRPAVHQQREVGVGMDIDEAGTHREPVQLDALLRLKVGQVPDARDSAVLDSDVGPERVTSRPVEDLSASEYHVDHGLSLPS